MIRLDYGKPKRMKAKYRGYVLHYDAKFILTLIYEGKLKLLTFTGNPSEKIVNCGKLCMTEYYPTYIHSSEVCTYYIYDPVRNTIAIENKGWTLIWNYLKKIS